MLAGKDITWHREAEVVMVGFGAAGAVAAITACDEGARVLILEKQAPDSHMNNTSMGGGIFIAVKDINGAIVYMDHLNKAGEDVTWTDSDIVRAWAEYASHNVEWIKKIGGHVKLLRKGGEHRHIPGCESIELYRPAGLGFGLMRWLKENIKSRHIEVMYNATAKRLLTSNGGEVIGVTAEKDGRRINIRASKAVVMAPGGFEFNEEMKLNYLRVYPAYFYGSPANTGDGIGMVQEIGASLWHMNCCSARLVAKFPEFPIAFSLDYGGRWLSNVQAGGEGDPCAYIIVDGDGKRFTNEGQIKPHTLYYELALYDSQRLLFPRVPSYMVFDRKRLQAGPLPIRAGPTGAHRVYNWSKDNKKELQKGWIVQGDTIPELAVKLEIKPAALDKTVIDYNGYCHKGCDLDFHRPAKHLKPLAEPPFFAIKLWPGGPNTQGGPRCNSKAQVLDVDGRPIPRLYAAGEFGSIFGMLYPAGGGNISECIAFGRIAGENAARERPEC